MARTTRNRRSSKHRGNAAGMIEARGRTGRKPSAAEKGSSTGRGGGGGSSGGGRRNRYERPPTWRGSLVRAAVAAVVVYGVSALLINKGKNPITNLVLIPIVLALYMPVIYYTDLFMFRRAEKRRTAR